MSDAKDQGEPTMEEILASIRKIISEDGTPEDGAPADAEAAEPEAAPEEVPEEVPEAAEEAAAEAGPGPDAEAAGDDEDVLDLTRMVGEDGELVDLDEDAEGAPELEAGAAEAAEMPDLIAVDDAEAVEPARHDVDSMLADTTQDAVTATLANLVAAAGPPGADGQISAESKTLEVLVREVMEPFLKSWLDEHLAGMVERIVRDEVQKMVRRAEYR